MVKPNRKTRNSTLSKWQQRCIDPPRNKPWAKYYTDTVDTEEWRDLGVNARRVMDALICHHFRYAQKDNGNLEISYSGFERAGVSGRRYIWPALTELVDAGQLGIGQGIAKRRYGFLPNKYEITMYSGAPGISYIERSNRQWFFIPIDVLESPAWAKLSLNARRMLDRLLIENIRHGRKENGRLRVSYEQFEGLGIGSRLIAPTCRELTAAGLLAITKGRRIGHYQAPNLYRITFAGTTDAFPTWRPLYAATDGTDVPKISTTEAPPEPPTKPVINIRKEAPAMQLKKHFPVAKGEVALVYKGEAALVYKGEVIETPRIVYKGEVSKRLLVSSPGASGEAAPPAQSHQADRTAQILAYATAHRSWIEKFGLPTHDQLIWRTACISSPSMPTPMGISRRDPNGSFRA
jgi:hypothetical protein